MVQLSGDLKELIHKNNIARFKLEKKDIGFENKMRLVLISDSHITGDHGKFNEEIFKEGIKRINNIKNVDFIIHLGDITDNGTESDYDLTLQLLELLKPGLRDKIFYIPGNHDVKNVGDRIYEEVISDQRNFTIELPHDSVIIGLDSTEPDENTGEIGYNTTRLFKKIIEQYSGLKIVCFHHQLIPIPKTGRERSAITDAGSVLKMLLDTNVNLVFNGHRHISNLYNMTDGKGELMVFNAGTISCQKTRFHQLWTYSIVDIEPDVVTFKVIGIKNPDQQNIIGRPFFAGVREPPAIINKDLIACIVHMANSGISIKHTHDVNAWKTAMNVINAIDCDVVVHSGSIVDNGQEEDFELASDMLGEIAHPKIVVPGLPETHYPMSWNYFQKYIGDLEPKFENENLLILGINSCQLETKSGIIGRRTLNSILTEAFPKLTQKIVGINLHHDLVPAPFERWEATLKDSGDSLAAFAISGIDLILSGSSYANWSVQVENAIFSSTGSISNRKATLHGQYGNRFNIIKVYEDGTTLIEEFQVKHNRQVLKRAFKIPILM
ncbi:MAG: metallophosphoesterase family protein [Promethearchaeota archaeon]